YGQSNLNLTNRIGYASWKWTAQDGYSAFPIMDATNIQLQRRSVNEKFWAGVAVKPSVGAFKAFVYSAAGPKWFSQLGADPYFTDILAVSNDGKTLLVKNHGYSFIWNESGVFNGFSGPKPNLFNVPPIGLRSIEDMTLTGLSNDK